MQPAHVSAAIVDSVSRVSGIRLEPDGEPASTESGFLTAELAFDDPTAISLRILGEPALASAWSQALLGDLHDPESREILNESLEELAGVIAGGLRSLTSIDTALCAPGVDVAQDSDTPNPDDKVARLELGFHSAYGRLRVYVQQPALPKDDEIPPDNDVSVPFVTQAGTLCLRFPRESGTEPFIEAAIRGIDYPPVFPDIFFPAVILDVGGHCGAALACFAARHPQARVISVEPCAASFEYLARNASLFPNASVHRIALSDRTGAATLFHGVHSSMQNSLKPNRENCPEGEVVDVLGAREFAGRNGLTTLSILKIDTEGCELEILGALVDRLASRSVVYLEYHSESDRRQLDAMLANSFVLFASRASEPHRGAVTYVSVALAAEALSLDLSLAAPK